MKFYSEVTKKLYDSEKELTDAEQRIKDIEAAKVKADELKKTQRTKRAKEVEIALKEATEANKKANKLLREFTKDYGYYHTSYTTKDADDLNFFDIVDAFLKY